MIVWVASYPRSGNRLCRSTLRQAFAVAARRIRGLQGRLAQRSPRPAGAARRRARRRSTAGSPRSRRPVFLKTHSLPEFIHTLPESCAETIPGGEEESPAIYLVRDGRDCFVSFATT